MVSFLTKSEWFNSTNFQQMPRCLSIESVYRYENDDQYDFACFHGQYA